MAVVCSGRRKVNILVTVSVSLAFSALFCYLIVPIIIEHVIKDVSVTGYFMVACTLWRLDKKQCHLFRTLGIRAKAYFGKL